MIGFNLSATLNVLRIFKNPALCYPHLTVSTFDQLPVPLGKAFGEKVDIRAVVLDKDNCFAKPHELVVFEAYRAKFMELRKEFPGNKLLIVSNSAGTRDDVGYKEAELLERNTGVNVLRHSTKKPGCYPEIFEYLRSCPDTGVTAPNQVAIVGDRLLTDVLMANMMGSYGVWVRDGVVPAGGTFFGRIERRLAGALEKGWRPMVPRGTFED
ncbi:hypothetical protein RUND412_004422 [Rhizina undulata]